MYSQPSLFDIEIEGEAGAAFARRSHESVSAAPRRGHPLPSTLAPEAFIRLVFPPFVTLEPIVRNASFNNTLYIHGISHLLIQQQVLVTNFLMIFRIHYYFYLSKFALAFSLQRAA